LSLEQPVIVENIGGASGSLGIGRAAKAVPDGYTICLGLWSTHVVNGVALALPYDVANDFKPIGLIASNPLLILGRGSLPADDLNGFLSCLKANPDKARLEQVETAERRASPGFCCRSEPVRRSSS
jgi:tripartite-type tricarboxylate transporter receptor subunit TctC